jgi:hypothetical protein
VTPAVDELIATALETTKCAREPRSTPTEYIVSNEPPQLYILREPSYATLVVEGGPFSAPHWGDAVWILRSSANEYGMGSIWLRATRCSTPRRKDLNEEIWSKPSSEEK